MTKICLINDSHIGARNDSHAFLEYFFKFYDNILFPYLEKNGITTVIHLGDLVDRRKFINYTILNRLKTDLIFKLKKMGIDFRVIVGNHDVPYRNTNSINALQELFGVDQGDSYPKFYSEATDINIGGTDLCLLPWINNSNYTSTLQHIKSTRAQIALGHLEIAGFHMNTQMISDHGIKKELLKGFELVLSGHYHTKSNQDNIHYLGTQYEITWSDYNDPKGFHILDLETRELERIVNPYKMFHKIFYNDKDKTLEQLTNYDFDALKGTYVKVVTVCKENPYWFDVFLDKIYKANPENISIVDDHKHMDQTSEEELIDEAEDTMTILRNYIEKIDTDVDKKRLTSLMGSLYNEAQHLD